MNLMLLKPRALTKSQRILLPCRGLNQAMVAARFWDTTSKRGWKMPRNGISLIIFFIRKRHSRWDIWDTRIVIFLTENFSVKFMKRGHLDFLKPQTLNYDYFFFSILIENVFFLLFFMVIQPFRSYPYNKKVFFFTKNEIYWI